MKSHLRFAVFLVHLLDNKFRIFNFRFGIDPLLGLIPGFGDAASLLLSFYLVWIGTQLKLPRNRINKMFLNIMLDFLFGLIPLAGDAIDFVYKANSRNLRIIREYSDSVIEGETDAL